MKTKHFNKLPDKMLEKYAHDIFLRNATVIEVLPYALSLVISRLYIQFKESFYSGE